MAHDLIDDPDGTEGIEPDLLLDALSRHRQRSERRRQRSRRLELRGRRLAVLLGVLAAAGLVGINVVIWDGALHIRLVSHTPSSTTSRESGVATSTHPNRVSTAPSRSVGGSKPQRKKKVAPPPPPKPRLVSVRLTAVRNDSWVQIRKDSSTGPVLFDAVVPAGQSVHVSGRGRLWARFGSLGNFDLTINGRPVRPAFNGTVDTVITPSTIRPAPAQTG